MTLADELNKLQALHEAGTLSAEEFQQAKSALLREQDAVAAWNSAEQAAAPPPPADRGHDTERDTRTWSVLLHISQFFWLVPFGGVLAPLVIWLIHRDRLPGIEPHFRAVVNWQLSALIYGICCIPLIFLLVGIPLLITLGLVALVYPVVGAIQAGDDKVWHYPPSIRFFR